MVSTSTAENGVASPREKRAEYEFDLSGGRLCLDFVNTVSGRDTVPVEHLNTYADLVAWGLQTGDLSGAKAEALLREGRRSPKEAARILREVLRVREVLYRAFLAVAGGDEPRRADVDALNAALGRAMARARIEAEGAADACCGWCWDDDPYALDRPLWPVLRSAAELLTSDEASRVRVCDAETCQWLFIDTSRNRSRRWCDMKVCGNRAKAQRHYRKMKAGA
jgi:predicted RNA-binding Zn ribbon-like protein